MPEKSRIEPCASCGANTRPDDVQGVMYDDHSESYFCDARCFEDWANTDGATRVLAFYERLNVSEC